MISSQTIIREMAEPDIKTVHALDELCFPTPWPLKSYYYELHENTASRMWVAVQPETPDQPERIIGMIVVWLLIDITHIATLAVLPDFRRQKIAYRLICTALNETLAEGAESATLEVRASNSAAQHLYRRFGFQLVGQRPNYYQDNGEAAILMTLHHLDTDHLTTIRCLNREP
jgi:ribosomal-protein-alanine N-acetyltransferase